MTVVLWIYFGILALVAGGAALVLLWNTLTGNFRLTDLAATAMFAISAIGIYSHNMQIKKLEPRTWQVILYLTIAFLAYSAFVTFARPAATQSFLQPKNFVSLILTFVFYAPIVYVFFRLSESDLPTEDELAALGSKPETYQKLSDNLFTDRSEYSYSAVSGSGGKQTTLNLEFRKNEDGFAIEIVGDDGSKHSHFFSTANEAVKYLHEQTIFRVNDLV